MAIELERHELRSFEIRKRKHKKKITILIIISILIIIVLGAFIVNSLLHKNYKSYEVVHTTKRSDSVTAKYLSFGTDILRYSRDGVMLINDAGKQLWNGSYEMNDPIVDMSDNYVAIGDRGYKSIELFDGTKTYQINTIKPITDVEVANQGVVAVLMDDATTNYIYLFSPEGETLIDSRTVPSKDGFPIDMDLSEDGTKMVTSYESLNNGTLLSKIVFYNFDEVGKNYESHVVGGLEYGETVFPKVEFINNDTVCAFGDDKINIYSILKIPELTKTIKLPSEVKSIFHSKKYIGCVVNNTDGNNPYRILIYDLKGKLKLDKTMNYSYNNITISGDEIIMYSNLEWIIWRINGEEKLHYKFNKNISYVLPINNVDKYVLIDDQNLEEVKLVEKSSAQK
jgi:hypothetical protein